MEGHPSRNSAESVQLHLDLPYKIEVRDDPRVRAYLERGYLIRDLQRVTDQEVLITLVCPSPA
jgi:hypothetical protein